MVGTHIHNMSSSNFFLAMVVGALKPSITFVSLPSLPLTPVSLPSLPLTPVLLPSLPSCSLLLLSHSPCSCLTSLTPSHSRLAPPRSCLTPLAPVLLPSLPLTPNGQNRLVGSQPFLWGQGARWELEGTRGVRGSETEGPHHLCGDKG